MCFTNTVTAARKKAKTKNQGSRAQLKQTLIATMVRPNETFSIKQLNFRISQIIFVDI